MAEFCAGVSPARGGFRSRSRRTGRAPQCELHGVDRLHLPSQPVRAACHLNPLRRPAGWIASGIAGVARSSRSNWNGLTNGNNSRPGPG